MSEIIEGIIEVGKAVVNVFIGPKPSEEEYSITDEQGASPKILPKRYARGQTFQAPRMIVIPPTDQIFRVENPELEGLSIDQLPYLKSIPKREAKKIQARLEDTI